MSFTYLFGSGTQDLNGLVLKVVLRIRSISVRYQGNSVDWELFLSYFTRTIDLLVGVRGSR